jgi:archaellum biogenesis ATPase FlaH
MTDYTFDKRDEFNRKEIAEKLIKVISSEINVSPIVIIDGKWGTGKTEFCKKLVYLANSTDEKNNYIYVDCFKYDSSDDPLLMLLTSVSQNIKNEVIKKDLIQKSLPVVKVIGGAVAKAAISWGLQVKADKFLGDLSKAISVSKETIADGVKETSNQIIDLGIGEAFENLEKIQENITKLREVLEKAAQEKGLVLVIDELDRCKPTFALNLLEKVKHIFDIKGIKIVLSTNLPHLEAVVLREYGLDINSEEYLRKFYKYKVILNRESSNDNYRYENNSYNEFLRQLDNREELKNCRDTENGHQFFKDFIVKNELSLRDIESFFRNYDVLKLIAKKYQLKTQSNWLRKLFVLFGVYLHTFEVGFCDKVLSDDLIEKDILNLFLLNISDLKKFDGHSIKTVLFFIFLRDLKESKIPTELNNSQSDKFQALDDSAKNLWARSELPGGGLGDRTRVLKEILKELHFFTAV